MGIQGCCNGVHHWYPVQNGSTHNERAVACRDYVAALEQLVRELGSSPELALASCMAGASSELPATDAGTQILCSRCRQNPPRPEGPWCWDCYNRFVDDVSGNGSS